MLIDVGIAQRPCLGERVCGDSYTVDVAAGHALIAVCDGLGHGPKAHEASTAFSECLRECGHLPVGDLMLAAHKRLSSTRGAAAAVLKMSESTGEIDFTGVGNIMLHSAESPRIHPVCAPGIVGHRLRKLLPFKFELPPAGLLVMCSDGIASRLELSHYEQMPAQEIADDVLETRGKEHDDATCVVVRYAAE